MKNIIILKNNGGRLANQLWAFANVYAYCLEKGYSCENYSFFRYHKYFNFIIKNRLINCLFLGKKKNIRLIKLLYNLYAGVVILLNKKYLVCDGGKDFLLPPTIVTDQMQKEIISKIDFVQHGTYYFCGWMFSNPEGLLKYHSEIKRAFMPKHVYVDMAEKMIGEIRKKFRLVVGVHIRQGDYNTWQGGKYFFDCKEVSALLHNFLTEAKISKDDVVFVLCSDGVIEDNQFSDLNFIKGLGTEIEDLYTLALVDLIIGSTSTYGSWASFIGDKPYVRFSREKIIWPKL